MCYYDNEDHFIGEGYFCNFDELPVVVACCMKVNPSLNESGYDPNTLFMLNGIHEDYGQPIKKTEQKKLSASDKVTDSELISALTDDEKEVLRRRVLERKQ